MIAFCFIHRNDFSHSNTQHKYLARAYFSRSIEMEIIVWNRKCSDGLNENEWKAKKFFLIISQRRHRAINWTNQQSCVLSIEILRWFGEFIENYFLPKLSQKFILQYHKRETNDDECLLQFKQRSSTLPLLDGWDCRKPQQSSNYVSFRFSFNIHSLFLLATINRSSISHTNEQSNGREVSVKNTTRKKESERAD